jgi:hypothetical protein
MGEAEMDRRILDKVLMTSRKISEGMPEQTGVSASLSDIEIKEYIEEVLAETHKRKSRNGKS